MVEYKTGDLFDPAFGFDAVGHGVNCFGKMGAGIAVVFRRDHPVMYEAYKRMCDQRFLLPGQVMPWYEDDIVIYNIASQYRPGADASAKYLAVGLRYVLFHMDHNNIQHLGLPQIGAGIGGLTFQTVSDTIEEVFKDSSRKVTVVSLPS